MSKTKPAQITDWLKSLKLTGLTKAHIKAVMSRMFKKAMLWELIPLNVNPMTLVEIRGASKRRKRPLILSSTQCAALIATLSEPYRTMVIVAQCTGLRTSEVLALKWSDIDFERLAMRVSRAVVRGIVDKVKTEYSEDELPLDPDFASELLRWKRQCPPSDADWVFPSPVTGRPYEPATIQQKVFKPAGLKLDRPSIGWHTFRHTYRSLLDAVGAPVGVQQKLMRHAEISTTMNIYGDADLQSKREANSKVVQKLKVCTS